MDVPERAARGGAARARAGRGGVLRARRGGQRGRARARAARRAAQPPARDAAERARRQRPARAARHVGRHAGGARRAAPRLHTPLLRRARPAARLRTRLRRHRRLHVHRALACTHQAIPVSEARERSRGAARGGIFVAGRGRPDVPAAGGLGPVLRGRGVRALPRGRRSRRARLRPHLPGGRGGALRHARRRQPLRGRRAVPAPPPAQAHARRARLQPPHARPLRTLHHLLDAASRGEHVGAGERTRAQQAVARGRPAAAPQLRAQPLSLRAAQSAAPLLRRETNRQAPAVAELPPRQRGVDEAAAGEWDGDGDGAGGGVARAAAQRRPALTRDPSLHQPHPV